MARPNSRQRRRNVLIEKSEVIKIMPLASGEVIPIEQAQLMFSKGEITKRLLPKPRYSGHTGQFFI